MDVKSNININLFNENICTKQINILPLQQKTNNNSINKQILKIMYTYKVTYFAINGDVLSVETYHNVAGGDAQIAEFIFAHMIAADAFNIKLEKSTNMCEYHDLTASFYSLELDRFQTVQRNVIESIYA